MTSDSRPTVRCFAAIMLKDGSLMNDAVFIVSLEAAALLRDGGWQIVGPDPNDLIMLASWEKRHGKKGWLG